MRYIVLDIETAAQPPEEFMFPDVDTLEPPATYKKPESIAQWREERRAALPAELRAKSSLEPLLGGIVVCVGIAVDEEPVRVLVAPTLDEAGECAILAKLEAGLLKYPDACLVTWNGAAFDLEYLRKRALRHGLCHLARRMWHEKPWNSPRHVDLRLAWCGSNKTEPGRLHQVARFLGVDVRDEVSGADVTRLLEEGDTARVVAHCESDVNITRELLHRFSSAGWVHLDTKADWTARDWRPAERDILLGQAMAHETAATDEVLKAAGAAAGLEWSDYTGGPLVTEATPIGPLRRYLAALEASKVH